VLPRLPASLTKVASCHTSVEARETDSPEHLYAAGESRDFVFAPSIDPSLSSLQIVRVRACGLATESGLLADAGVGGTFSYRYSA
jgi:hypothetical protein